MTHSEPNPVPRAGGLRRWLMTVGLILLLAAAFVVGRASQGGAGLSDDDAAAHDHGDHDSEPTWYQCPMHPDQQSTDPDATCPICGMDLVEMTADADETEEEAHLPVLRLDERARALMNIEVSPVERRHVEAPVHFVGKLEADETRLRDVVARTPSYVEELYANYRWQMVREGEPLAELYSPQVQAAARELLILHGSERADGGRERSLEAAKAKLERLGVSTAQIERILETGEVPRTYQIHSPIDGHVMYLSGQAGHWLNEGDRLIQLMDPSHLWVELEAYERDLARLRSGLPVELTVEAYPGETFEGEVSFIDPHLDPRTRTAGARIEVSNPDLRLKPGMFARGKVRTRVDGSMPRLVDVSSEATVGSDEAPLVIPASAPLRTGRRAVVYVQDPDADQPRFEGRQITLGPRAGDYYLVHEGLEEGERVVTRGAFKIDSELQIRGRPSMMSPAGFAAHPEDAPDTHDAGEEPPLEHEVPEPFAAQVTEALEHYFELSEALAADDLDAAREAARASREHVAAMDADALSAEAAEAWRELAPRLDEPLRTMIDADDLGTLRHHLAPLSDALEHAAIAFGGDRTGPLHRMHCPMAHDDEGAEWLQRYEQLHNPYMGEASGMLRCGWIERTIIEE